jgi:hypothetical protein
MNSLSQLQSLGQMGIAFLSLRLRGGSFRILPVVESDCVYRDYRVLKMLFAEDFSEGFPRKECKKTKVTRSNSVGRIVAGSFRWAAV